MERSMFEHVRCLNQAQEDSYMLKIVLAVSAAAALVTTAPLVTPAKSEGVKMAQGVDVQVGRDRDDSRYDRDRRYNGDRDTTLRVGPAGFATGHRDYCRVGTTP